ncbi:MAG: HEPN domain-containing protein [Methylomonas sp.]|nr:HEPN domain-containing protein [Methylomonas sp.]PPD22848.1 MAG: DNA-binding protein [Methylomonas sp.]PPD25383.1 MAG: DNA-binding protein [Methylomonas sp.]PPD35399.1 MAG: DNA-binding protein [Methylomonas sp.]PPD41827.1 MAG: DNA-binding protein [Methylomonas sp.]
MSDIEQAKSLMRIVRRDFNAVLGMADSPLFADEIFGFHAQQAVEKALKAWLCTQNQLYPLTHELPRLLALLGKIGADVEAFMDLDELTTYAVEARYAEGEPGEPCLNRSDVIRKVGALLAHVDSVVAAATTTPKA